MLDRIGRERAVRVLSIAVEIGVVVWIVSTAILYSTVFRSGGGGWSEWIGVVSTTSYSVWLGALALLLLMWLRDRLPSTPQE